MKIQASVTVDIDPAAWTLNYGVEGAAEIRQDVRRYIENVVHSQLAEVGVLTVPTGGAA